MYVIRRIAKAQPGKVWQVANLLIKICAAYEETGRPKAHVYVSQGMPGMPNVGYAEWTQTTGVGCAGQRRSQAHDDVADAQKPNLGEKWGLWIAPPALRTAVSAPQIVFPLDIFVKVDIGSRCIGPATRAKFTALSLRYFGVLCRGAPTSAPLLTAWPCSRCICWLLRWARLLGERRDPEYRRLSPFGPWWS